MQILVYCAVILVLAYLGFAALGHPDGKSRWNMNWIWK